MRACAKPRCDQPAAATVAVRYADRTVVVTSLISERNPNFLDLCDGHAEGLRPPLGWERRDRRGEPAPGQPHEIVGHPV